MKPNTTNTQNPTPEQVEAWKKEWGAKDKRIHKLTVGDKVGYIHDPERKTLSRAMNQIAQNNIVGGVETILENCWLGGDEAIKINDRYFMGAANIIDKLIQAESATLEKL